MTPQEFAKLQRDYLIRTEKQSANVIAAEFAAMNAEIEKFLIETFDEKTTLANLYAKNYLERILLLVGNQIERVSIPFSQILTRAQSNVIKFSSDSLKRFLRLKIESKIFAPDRAAIRHLIGRAFDGTTLQKFFARMKPVMVNRVRTELIEGFALGESSEQIARRIVSVSDAQYRHALVLSRNETVTAYRAATREFYREAGIKHYVWLSALDPRTCLICWFLHGRKFKTKVKIFSHVGCRCVLSPIIKNQQPIKTGMELFKILETGYQKQILGAKRFEMFEAGKSFDDFVGSRRDLRRGEMFFVKNLSDLMS